MKRQLRLRKTTLRHLSASHLVTVQGGTGGETVVPSEDDYSCETCGGGPASTVSDPAMSAETCDPTCHGC